MSRQKAAAAQPVLEFVVFAACGLAGPGGTGATPTHAGFPLSRKRQSRSGFVSGLTRGGCPRAEGDGGGVGTQGGRRKTTGPRDALPEARHAGMLARRIVGLTLRVRGFLTRSVRPTMALARLTSATCAPRP